MNEVQIVLNPAKKK